VILAEHLDANAASFGRPLNNLNVSQDSLPLAMMMVWTNRVSPLAGRLLMAICLSRRAAPDYATWL
jgi:hypothetical protein